MSGYGPDEGSVTRTKDPLLRFLAGCAVVVAVIVAVVVSSALLIGWRLARDESPGRVAETFLLGDETRYWCLDLKPDDAGLQALFARFEEINDASRRKLFRGTFLESLPIPHRRARLDELAPMSLELSLSTTDPASLKPLPAVWAARGTLSHGLFSLRASLKVMRFLAGRNAAKLKTFDVSGVAVTEIRDERSGFSVATVGNRFLVTSDASRMRAILQPVATSPGARIPELLKLHDEIAIEGEDAWSFASATRLGGMTTPVSIDGAAASFDINDRDELSFRIVVLDSARVTEGSPFRGKAQDCSEVVAMFLPGVPGSAIEIHGDGGRRREGGRTEFSGRIPDLSKRLAELVGRASDFRMRERKPPPAGTEKPSATPTPPPPPPTDDPQSGTPAARTREGTPTPRR